MSRKSANLTRKQEVGLAALLSAGTIEEAARVADVNASTLRRWLGQPDFKTAFREARRSTFEGVMAQIQQGAGRAAAVLLELLDDSDSPASTRLRAAELILTHAVKSIELNEIEDRLVALEKANGGKN